MQEPKVIIKQLLGFYWKILGNISSPIVHNPRMSLTIEDFKEIVILKGTISVCAPRVGFNLNIPKIGKFTSLKRKKLEDDLNKILQRLREDQNKILFPLRWRSNDESHFYYLQKDVIVAHTFNYKIDEKELPSELVKLRKDLIEKHRTNFQAANSVRETINILCNLKPNEVIKELIVLNKDKIIEEAYKLSEKANLLITDLDKEIEPYKTALYALLGLSEEKIKNISYQNFWNS